jgi:serine/threonine-protein kinase
LEPKTRETRALLTCPTCKSSYPEGQITCPKDGETLLPEEFVQGLDETLAPGTSVGEYVVDSKLGEGAFGAVYKGAQPLIGKRVAIKVLARKHSSEPVFVSRFISEARAVNQIQHRNIIDIFSFGQLADGRHYYVMEYVDGVTLDRYLADRGRLGVGETIYILRALARALDAAHQKGIAHRDLKPANVFIARDEEGQPFPKLLDFGIAKLLSVDPKNVQHRTQTGVAMGTPQYMSPEQCHGRDVDHRADIYSFGIMTYQLVTGVLPFLGDSYMAILMKQISEAPRPPSAVCPDLPVALDAPVLWMMAKEPAERPLDLVTGVAALEDAARSVGLEVPAITQPRIGSEPSASVRTFPSGPTPVLDTATGSAPTIPRGSGISDPRTAAPVHGRRGPPLPIKLLAPILLIAIGAFGALKLVDRAPVPPPIEPALPAAPPELARPAEPPEPPPRPPKAEPAMVTLTVEGAPAGTEVLGSNGERLGAAPGAIQLVRSDQPIRLVFHARGYEPSSEEVRPQADGKLSVRLQRLHARPKPSAPATPTKKKHDQDSIEEAFDR